MDRSDVVSLIAQTFFQDEIGQEASKETKRDVFCNVSSITRNEWFEAAKSGFQPQLRITMLRYDYQNERIVEFKGVRYAVYRTYESQKELIELYLEDQAGV
ncbi:MAG: phage head-tail adapter protein [Christensenellales bacterium]